MPSGINIRDSGVWRFVTRMYVKVSGVWQEIDKAYVKDGGNWDDVFTGCS